MMEFAVTSFQIWPVINVINLLEIWLVQILRPLQPFLSLSPWLTKEDLWAKWYHLLNPFIYFITFTSQGLGTCPLIYYPLNLIYNNLFVNTGQYSISWTSVYNGIKPPSFAQGPIFNTAVIVTIELLKIFITSLLLLHLL